MGDHSPRSKIGYLCLCLNSTIKLGLELFEVLHSHTDFSIHSNNLLLDNFGLRGHVTPPPIIRAVASKHQKRKKQGKELKPSSKDHRFKNDLKCETLTEKYKRNSFFSSLLASHSRQFLKGVKRYVCLARFELLKYYQYDLPRQVDLKTPYPVFRPYKTSFFRIAVNSPHLP